MVVEKMKNWLYSLLTGVLLWLAWPTHGHSWLIFVALLPLLQLAQMQRHRGIFFLQVYVAMLIWNAGTTWWIWNSSVAGAAMAVFANSCLMCLPWMGYYAIRKRFNAFVGAGSLVSYWMLFEYNHYNWQLNWPWLSLGNVFATELNWIQWYEYTGVAGGSLWVLLVNLLLFGSISSIQKGWRQAKWFLGALAVLLIVLPIFWSNALHSHKKGWVNGEQVVIVQPNIDPYAKFTSNSVAEQLALLVQLSENAIDTNTRVLLWPETALSGNVAIEEVHRAPIYNLLYELLHKHPQVTLITGVESYKILGTEKTTATARKSSQGIYYDSYNAAVTLSDSGNAQYYIKSKLVPGVESLPTYLNFLGNIFEQFGGTAGGYAKDIESRVFTIANSKLKAAPIICYESVYGAYVASYVKKGANLLSIITNDGWWGNTDGHKQHLAYAQLRAIENRRFVVRSANTGISAVINPFGQVEVMKGWDTAAVLKYTIPVHATDKLTFYSKHGDYLYLLCSIPAFVFLAIQLINYLKQKFFKRA